MRWLVLVERDCSFYSRAQWSQTPPQANEFAPDEPLADCPPTRTSYLRPRRRTLGCKPFRRDLNRLLLRASCHVPKTTNGSPCSLRPIRDVLRVVLTGGAT